MVSLNSTAKADGAPPLHLDYLDGLRGLAALYVVVHHAVLIFCGEIPRYEPSKLGGAKWLIKGHYAVAVFIVLSGFCLMLPVARAGGMLRGGLWAYVRRRSWRILPPYYAAMATTFVIIAVVPAMSRGDGVFWSMSLPADTPAVIISHLLLVHNLHPDWAYRIDPPMWSVATEWQIYFVFPLLLLPVWRRVGTSATIFIGMAIGVGIHFARTILPITLTQACPWYIALFGFGMGAAAVSFNRARSTADQRIINLARLTGPMLLLTVLALMYATDLDERKLMPFDLAVGAATCCLLITLATSPGSLPVACFRWILNSRPLVGVGHFSYSLYLLHCPVIVLLYRTTPLGHSLSPMWRLNCLLAIGVTASLACSYLFYLMFERPFLRRASKHMSSGVTVVSPQPVPALSNAPTVGEIP